MVLGRIVWVSVDGGGGKVFRDSGREWGRMLGRVVILGILGVIGVSVLGEVLSRSWRG